MVGLNPAAALGAILLASGALGGCATVWRSGTPLAGSYEATGAYQEQYRQVAEDLARSLAASYAPAQTTVQILPPNIFRLGPASGFLSHDPDTPSFGWELEQALRQRGFAVLAAEDADQEAFPESLPLNYVIDEIGKEGYRAGVCVAREWCADRLYQRAPDGLLVPAGGAIRTLVVRT